MKVEMKRSDLCEKCRLEWMVLFDAGEEVALLESMSAHLRECPDCRDFVRTSERARREIRCLSLPQPDPGADQAVLAALRTREEARRGWRGLEPVLDALRGLTDRRTVLPLAGAGLASFVATLLLAGGLSSMTVGEEKPLVTRAARPGDVRRSAVDYASRLDAWLEQQSPVPPRPLMPPVPLRRPESPPAEPWRRGQGIHSCPLV
jgi:hypothetical protein